MRPDSLLGYFAIMTVSLMFTVGSMVAISLKDKTWINWQTFPGVQIIGIHYVLPLIHLLAFGPDGSVSSYLFCYVTYALSSLALTLTYCLIKPLRIRVHRSPDPDSLSILPWALLALGTLIYVPVLVAFRQYLTEPRQIYAEFSHAGYGLNFFLSSTLILLAYIAYLFKRQKLLAGKVAFLSICVAMIYLHGSKGQLLALVFISFLYQVYIRGKRISFLKATVIISSLGVLGGLVFAVFGSVGDRLDLLATMSAYADLDRNAMLVIDDSRAQRYYGQLEFEQEFYPRMPRILVPNKPREFGDVRLATTYYPEWVRDSAGTPSFGIGLQYADFGPYGLLLVLGGSIMTGWFARTIVHSLGGDASLGKFLLLLFFSGIAIIPIGFAYLLPETILLGLTLSFFQRSSIRLLRSPYPDGRLTAQS